MSDEDRVTPVEAALDAAPARVTPKPGEGALGAWRTPMITPVWTQSPKSLVQVVSLSSGRANRSCQGCMRARASVLALSGRLVGEGGQGRQPDSRNSTVRDEIGGSKKRDHGGTVTPPRNRKGGAGNPPPVGARASILSRQSNSRYSTRHALKRLGSVSGGPDGPVSSRVDAHPGVVHNRSPRHLLRAIS